MCGVGTQLDSKGPLMTHYQRPAERIVPSPKVPVDTTCPNCGSREVFKYPVNSEGGWFMVVRCQGCLHQTQRSPWRLHGPVEFLADQIEGL